MRSSAFPEYDTYGTSPADDFSYSSSSSLPRQPSYSSSSYGAESFRPWTAGSSSAPVTSTSMYYEPGAAFTGSFGTLQAGPAYTPAPVNRLPSVASEAFSPLNMASMHSSLPSQTVQERRLPIPFTQTYAPPTYSVPELPQIRPLGSFTEPRAHINGIYSQTGMPWSSKSQTGSSTRSESLSSLPMPDTGSSHAASVSSSYTSDPILGYQFSASTGSPTISPTAGPALSESLPGTNAMLPPSRRRISRGSQSHPNLPSLTGGSGDDYQYRSSSSREAAASLYSFSTGVDPSDRSASSERKSHQHHQHHHNNNSNDQSQGSNGYTTHHRQPQPQHAASVDELRQRSSHDHHQQQQRAAATAHRISVSSLNARY